MQSLRASFHKQLILAVQFFGCFYCGKKWRWGEELHSRFVLDHLSPKSKGGPNDLLNRVVACRKCDAEKKDRVPTPDELARKEMQNAAYRTVLLNATYQGKGFKVNAKKAIPG